MRGKSDRVVLLLATGCGLGYSPVASGTVGTLPGVVLAVGLCSFGWVVQVAVCVALTLVSITICDRADRIFGVKDDGRIVADEYLTFPICAIGLPLLTHPWLIPAAFVVARIMDIVKIPPADQAQEIPGGTGIVLDDMIANIYALGLLHLGLRVVPGL